MRGRGVANTRRVAIRTYAGGAGPGEMTAGMNRDSGGAMTVTTAIMMIGRPVIRTMAVVNTCIGSVIGATIETIVEVIVIITRIVSSHVHPGANAAVQEKRNQQKG